MVLRCFTTTVVVGLYGQFCAPLPVSRDQRPTSVIGSSSPPSTRTLSGCVEVCQILIGRRTNQSHDSWEDTLLATKVMVEYRFVATVHTFV